MALQPTLSPPLTHRRDSINPADRHSSIPWSPQDDQQLMIARQQGLNWAPIANKFFPTKTPNACRKRHERLMDKRNSNGSWEGVKVETLAKAYLDVREEMWKILAAKVNENWKTVEQKCMEKGLKTLQNTGRSATRRERNNQPQETTNDSPLILDTIMENPAEGENFGSTGSYPSSSRRTTLSNPSPGSYTPTTTRAFPQPPLPSLSTTDYLPSIKSILGSHNPHPLPVTTH
ncbi:MAG: hypothetical protein LQ342_007067 [Letrouitia transgressa]|nr:MAG: hypothetical protein LQ342_007067 [Letrouitia transgressa]